MAIQAQSSPPAALMQLMFGRWPADMIAVAAELGISDELAHGPLTSADLAIRTGAHADSLHRLLRALASIGVYSQTDTGEFALAPLGELLKSDVPGSLRELAIMVGQEWHSRAWDALGAGVRTGATPFERVHGVGIFDYLLAHPQAAANFNAAMTGFAEATRTAVADAYDFSSIEALVDVGGGHGALLAKVLSANPNVTGVLFDLPPVVEGARRELESHGLDGRCKFVGGDFFEAVPAGADAYVLTGILHDWDDEHSLTILRSCRKAILPSGRLLIGEQVLPQGNEPSFGKLLDIEMFVLTSGGRERTEAEYRALLGDAGFELERVIATDGPTSVLEAFPA